ncbi:phosphoribosylanthranilate isomerase [Erythrobacter sp. SDW2]|uniref:phosphoribosylanthranilate isomerase n=1 Tax=Erythrobacter sp. SDW2 TaxID=2907154 RepID=UPI001F232F8C|nr:phosphoribosylanthranilate isomerase [Erythrobacter sp. SDW2]UIP05509.1 phosphoribosylanthranilate isomerase [Erythrobacter sp. SDW2]
MTGIKICGIDRAKVLEAAIAARASHVGLVFFPPSPRFLSSADAAALSLQAKGRVIRVGLFVDPDDAALTEGVATGLDAIQLHGEESPARVAEVKARYGLEVWKVLPVATADDIARSHAYHGAADFLLFDAKTPKGALPGGMGLRFDWSLLTAYRGPTAWGLAGGLNAGNVAQAIARTGAPLVDASSGIESAPGVKDVTKIVAFCAAAHRGA